MTDRFSRDMMISGFGHGLIFVLIFVRAVFAPSEPMQIRRAIRVDVVDLPQKLNEETLPPPAPPSPPQPSAATPKPEPVTQPPAPKPSKPEPIKLKAEKTAKAQNQAINKLKAQSTIEKFKQDLSHEKKNAPTKPAASQVAGNVISKGNSLSGLEKIEYDRYLVSLEEKIRSNWSIPQWLADADFKAQVQILIDERGYIVKKIFLKSSHNEVFDAKVMEALEGSSPLPPPPARLHGFLSTSGIVVNFPE